MHTLLGSCTHVSIPTHQMVELYKNPSGDRIFLSKYHPENLGSTNKLAFRGLSFTSSLSNLDPTSSLKSLFRTVSGPLLHYSLCYICRSGINNTTRSWGERRPCFLFPSCLQTSMDSALVLTERKCRQEDRDGDGRKTNTVVRNVHFTLPKVKNSVRYLKSQFCFLLCSSCAWLMQCFASVVPG